MVFLVVGMVLMSLARVLSESIVFYYGSAMTVGIILVILMILFQLCFVVMVGVVKITYLSHAVGLSVNT